MRFSIALFSILLCDAQEDAARAQGLVEKLRSDQVEDRAEAERQLKEMGKAARPELDKPVDPKSLELPK